MKEKIKKGNNPFLFFYNLFFIFYILYFYNSIRFEYFLHPQQNR